MNAEAHIDTLVREHWNYIQSVLKHHNIPEEDIRRAGKNYRRGMRGGFNSHKRPDKSFSENKKLNFHYRTAYIHGAKHWFEFVQNSINSDI